MALTHTHREIADAYGTTPRVVASWLEDVRAGRGLVASVYAPSDSELIDAARRLLDAGIAKLARELEHSTGKDAIAIVREGRETLVALASLSVPENAAPAISDADVIADFERALAVAAEERALRN